MTRGYRIHRERAGSLIDPHAPGTVYFHRHFIRRGARCNNWVELTLLRSIKFQFYIRRASRFFHFPPPPRQCSAKLDKEKRASSKLDQGVWSEWKFALLSLVGN